MKFSTAMRKGSEQHPQSFIGLFEFSNSTIIKTCAMGAGLVGVFGFTRAEEVRSSSGILDPLFTCYPMLQDKTILCPEEPCRTQYPDSFHTLYMLIEHLNDVHEWPREDIATWLEQFEEE